MNSKHAPYGLEVTYVRVINGVLKRTKQTLWFESMVQRDHQRDVIAKAKRHGVVAVRNTSRKIK